VYEYTVCGDVTDIVDKTTRSRMMSGIGGKNTKPEMLIRQGLHHMGFRYRLHVKDLPGKPDMVFPKYNAIILINGCFWHQHDCHMFKWPSTRREFWHKKLVGNRERDQRNLETYQKLGWKVLVIWECAVKGRTKRSIEEVIHTAANWLQFDQGSAELSGYWFNE
jgi:DNA mismatch endonuclease (patch repair protein)